MTQAINMIHDLSEESLAGYRRITLDRNEVVDRLIELIERQTEGKDRADFDVECELLPGVFLRVTGEIVRTYKYHPDSYDTPSEYECRAQLYVDEYQCLDEWGEELYSNFSIRWLENLHSLSVF